MWQKGPVGQEQRLARTGQLWGEVHPSELGSGPGFLRHRYFYFVCIHLPLIKSRKKYFYPSSVSDRYLYYSGQQ